MKISKTSKEIKDFKCTSRFIVLSEYVGGQQGQRILILWFLANFSETYNRKDYNSDFITNFKSEIT